MPASRQSFKRPLRGNESKESFKHYSPRAAAALLLVISGMIIPCSSTVEPCRARMPRMMLRLPRRDGRCDAMSCREGLSRNSISHEAAPLERKRCYDGCTHAAPCVRGDAPPRRRRPPTIRATSGASNTTRRTRRYRWRSTCQGRRERAPGSACRRRRCSVLYTGSH